jgi:FkbM family methyltransferase
MLAFRIYESAEIRFIRSFLRGAERVIEVGGGLGVTGSHLLQVMARGGDLTSVEANDDLIPPLRRTLLAHAGGKSVTVIHAAVAETHTAFLEKVSDSNLSSRLAPGGMAVPAKSLAAIASRAHHADYALFSDIEGAEASYIFAPNGLTGCSRMVIELHETIHEGQPVTRDDMVGELQRLGFRLLGRHGNVYAFAR